MFNRAINASLMGAVMAFGLALSGQALADLTAAEAVLADAKGVLVCPKIRKGGFTIGIEGASAC